MDKRRKEFNKLLRRLWYLRKKLEKIEAEKKNDKELQKLLKRKKRLMARRKELEEKIYHHPALNLTYLHQAIEQCGFKLDKLPDWAISEVYDDLYMMIMSLPYFKKLRSKLAKIDGKLNELEDKINLKRKEYEILEDKILHEISSIEYIITVNFKDFLIERRKRKERYVDRFINSREKIFKKLLEIITPLLK